MLLYRIDQISTAAKIVRRDALSSGNWDLVITNATAVNTNILQFFSNEHASALNDVKVAQRLIGLARLALVNFNEAAIKIHGPENSEAYLGLSLFGDSIAVMKAFGIGDYLEWQTLNRLYGQLTEASAQLSCPEIPTAKELGTWFDF
jgi:hypothetical protein